MIRTTGNIVDIPVVPPFIGSMSTVDFQPTLVGETVNIRPLQSADWAEMFAAGSDPAIWELHPAPHRYTEPVFRAYFESGLASRMAFAFVERATGAIIGGSRYHDYEEALGEVEIGWTFLTRAHWGGRTNGEIKRLMIDYAFTFADTVIFWVGETNWRSQRAMKKIGGVLRPGFRMRAASGASGPPSQHVIFEIKKTSTY